MNGPRTIFRMLAGGVCLATAVASARGGPAGGPPLPAAAHYADLPPIFDRVLQNARATADSRGGDPAAVRELARLYQANELDREAQACYRAIAATPSGLTARDHYFLADIARHEGDLGRAETELRAVLAAEPRYLPARVALAESLANSGRDDEAVKEFSAVLAIEEDQPQASVGLARIELRRGQEAAAAARLEDLMAAHPESAAGAALLALLLERRGETDRAIALTQLSQAKPDPVPADPWLEELLGDVYDIRRLRLKSEEWLRAGQFERAVPLLQRIEEIEPRGFLPPLLRGRAQTQAHHDREAVEQYRLALARGGDPEEICPDLVRSLLVLGDVSGAATLMAGACAERPDSVPLATAYADVAIRRGDQSLARTLLEKVLQNEPALKPQNMSLANILWNAGERDAAAKCLQRVAAADPEDVASRALLGEYYLGKADPFAAIEPLERASACVPAKTPAQKSLLALLAAAYLQAGGAESERGRYAEAIDYYDKAIRLFPDDPNGYAGKARACVQLKQFRRAAEELQKLVALDPENPTIHLSLGDVVYQDGNAAEAQRHWQAARRLLGPGDRELREAVDLRLSGRITADTFR